MPRVSRNRDNISTAKNAMSTPMSTQLSLATPEAFTLTGSPEPHTLKAYGKLKAMSISKILLPNAWEVAESTYTEPSVYQIHEHKGQCFLTWPLRPALIAANTLGAEVAAATTVWPRSWSSSPSTPPMRPVSQSKEYARTASHNTQQMLVETSQVVGGIVKLTTQDTGQCIQRFAASSHVPGS